MIEGPRAVALCEMASLSKLVDKVFMGGVEGVMFRSFPTLFNEANRNNCLVFVDDGRVVAHAGMTQLWAGIAGCTLRVACIGAVSTDEAYRNRGLGSQLFAALREKALADGVDFMMISGDRTLYRRAGAVDHGRDLIAIIDEPAAESLHAIDMRVHSDDFAEMDFSACSTLYDARLARFVRPLDDWQRFAKARIAMCADVDIKIAERRGVTRGYLIVRKPNKDGMAEVIEFAGEDAAIAGALSSVLRQLEARTIKIRLQQGDVALKGALEGAGVTLLPEKTVGTMLLIDFQQMMARLAPWFESRIGVHQANALSFSQEGERFMFTDGDKTVVLDRGQAGTAIFGYPEKPFFQGLLAQVFPIPSLYYGLNYV